MLAKAGILGIMGTYRKVVRWLLVGVLLATAIAVISGVFGEFFIEWAREQHYYENPSQKLDAAMKAFSEFVTQPWFLLLAALLAGLTVGAWIDVLLRRAEARIRENPRLTLPLVLMLGGGLLGAFSLAAGAIWYIAEIRPNPPAQKTEATSAQPLPDRPDTRLRIRLDPSGTRQYLQVAQSNIYRWQQTIVAMEGMGAEGSQPLLHVDNLSIVFDEAIEYERPILEPFGHKLGSYNFFRLGNRGAVFQFFDRIQAPLVEIWFPPPGYYAERQANEGAGSQPQSPQDTEEEKQH